MTDQKLIFTIVCIVGFGSSVLGVSVSTDDEVCPQICPLLYAPVCASNGKMFKEFSNDCELKALNCRKERDSVELYAKTDIALCHSVLVENLSEKLGIREMHTSCLKPCTMDYRPVCVTNGKYRALVSNPCSMEVLNCTLEKFGITELLRSLKFEHCQA